MLESGKTTEGMAALKASSARRFRRESTLVGIGHRLLNRGHTESSLAVFELATARHPKSANAWESLSEALERAGRNADPVKQAKHALKLAPEAQVRQAAEERGARLAGK